MANEEHLNTLKKGLEVWNAWQHSNPTEEADLNGADLRESNLRSFDLNGADLRGADLKRADLDETDLSGANLSGAQLSGSSLVGAKFEDTSLAGANLDGANLTRATLERTVLSGANFNQVKFLETVLNDVDLSEVQGLATCKHAGRSCVDYRVLLISKSVPLVFWRGCGLPDTLIDYILSIVTNSLEFYSCFISYSSKDQEFATRLHSDLQNAGVRCWFAPHDLPIGEKILDGIDEAIRVRDKVLLILSEGSIASDWVEDEVTTAFEEERQRKETMLFPIRLDDAVLETNEAWASKLRARNIGDFTGWKEYDRYKARFDRVLRDLKAER